MSSYPLPITSTGNDMTALMSSRMKQDKEPKAGKAGAKGKAIATKEKAAKSSSANESTTSPATEGQQRQAKLNCSWKAKDPRQKAPPNATPKTLSAAKG